MRKKTEYTSKYLEAYDIATDLCLQMLKKEMKNGVTTAGNGYESPTILHGKLDGIVDILGKIQKGLKLAEANEGANKLDRILAEINEHLSGSGAEGA